MSTEQALRTQADVFRLPLPQNGEAVYFDEGKPKDRASGLALRIRAAGSRKFVFFYRLGGRLLKFTIGDASSWTLDQARANARGLRVKVDRGENPATEKATRRADAALLFSAVMRDYLDARRPEMKPRSHEECTRHLEKHWRPLHGMAMSAIDRAAVAVHLKAIAKDSGAVTANRARSTLSAMFAWAIGEGLCEANPVIGTNKKDEGGSRARVLTDAELAAVWNAAPDNDYGTIVKLLMLTAQRRDEIGGLEWSEIDVHAKMISLPASRTKNNRPHDVPLSSAALALIEPCPDAQGARWCSGAGRAAIRGGRTLRKPWTPRQDSLRRGRCTISAAWPRPGWPILGCCPMSSRPF
jgi:hypothetical protein